MKFSAAFIGGLVAGTLWHVNNLFGFLYVSRVVTNTNMCRSLRTRPGVHGGSLFFLGDPAVPALRWLTPSKTAWRTCRTPALADNVNQRGREFVALRLMTCLGLRFQNGARPATIPDISTELGVPSRLVQQVLHTLLCARLVTETHAQETGYVPARPLEDINAWQILLAMRTVGGQELAPCEATSRAEVTGEFARIEEAKRQAAVSLTMQALVQRTRSATALPKTAATTMTPARLVNANAELSTEIQVVAEVKAKNPPDGVIPVVTSINAASPAEKHDGPSPGKMIRRSRP